MFEQFLFILFAVCNAQQLIDLKDFPANTVSNISAVGPYSIYVSASSDDDSLLKQVSISDLSSMSTKTLWDLKHNKLFQNSGLLQPFAVATSAVLISTLSNEKMAELKGSLYITTAQQLRNTNGFLVYDVQVSEKIQITDDHTLVFLNTNYNKQPWQSSTISAWKQTEGSTVYLYEGIPTDAEEKENTHIFSNPVLRSDGSTKFIPSVEIFSLSLGAFYLKAHKGVQFVIDPNYYDVNNGITTSKITTGFYMKSIASPDSNITINISHDSLYGTTGVNVIGHVPVNTIFSVSGPKTWSTNPTSVIQPWSVAQISDSLRFQTVNSAAGEIFVQYYIIQGIEPNPLASTTTANTILPGRQTTALPYTTTKPAAVLQVFTSILISLSTFRFL